MTIFNSLPASQDVGVYWQKNRWWDVHRCLQTVSVCLLCHGSASHYQLAVQNITMLYGRWTALQSSLKKGTLTSVGCYVCPSDLKLSFPLRCESLCGRARWKSGRWFKNCYQPRSFIWTRIYHFLKKRLFNWDQSTQYILIDLTGLLIHRCLEIYQRNQSRTSKERTWTCCLVWKGCLSICQGSEHQFPGLWICRHFHLRFNLRYLFYDSSLERVWTLKEWLFSSTTV